MEKVSKEYWGPRVWRMFHLLANISDRRDVPSVWRQLLRASAHVLPCEKCRVHFADYLKTHVLVKTVDPTKTTGPLIRETLKDSLRVFHNVVNKRLGKPSVTKEAYAALYLPQSREATLLEVQAIFEELKHVWAPLAHTSLHTGQFTLWKNTLAVLLALLRAGPTR